MKSGDCLARVRLGSGSGFMFGTKTMKNSFPNKIFNGAFVEESEVKLNTTSCNVVKNSNIILSFLERKSLIISVISANQL